MSAARPAISSTAKANAAPRRPRDATRLIPWLLVIASLIAYGAVFVHQFVGYDDSMNLYANPRLNPPTAASILGYWKEVKEGAFGLYIPLTYTVWGILSKATFVETPDDMNNHLDPRLFHATNLLFHILAVCTAYQLLRRLTGRPWAAGAGAALFALHPLQVESICWAAGLKDVMCGLLSLTALNQYLAAIQPKVNSDREAASQQGASHDGASQPVSRLHYALALLAFVGAMLSKPTAVVTPALALALDRWAVKRPWKRVFAWLLPWFLLAVPFVIIGRIAQYTDNVHGTTAINRPFVAGVALSFYIEKLILPVHLAIDYGLMPAYLVQHRWTYVLWILPVGLAALTWWKRWRLPLLWVAFVLFAIPLLPNSGILPFQFQYYSVVADHYMYLPMIGPALGVAWAMSRWHNKRLAIGCTVGLILLLARSIDQVRTWQDSLTLNSQALAVNDRSFLAENNLGFEYDEEAKWLLVARDIPRARQAADLARHHYQEAARLNPDDTHGWGNLTSLDLRLLNPEPAIAEGRQLVRANRKLPPRSQYPYLVMYLGIAKLAADTGHYQDAEFFLNAILELKPDDAEALEEFNHLRKQMASPASTQPSSPTLPPPLRL